MSIILIFGGSITAGYWDEQGGWVQRLRVHIDKKFIQKHNIASNNYHNIYNLGIDGDTTKGVADRLENEIKARLWGNSEILPMFSIGVNDTIFMKSKGMIKSSEKEFENNIRKIISISKRFSSKIVMMGLAPIDEEKTTPVLWDNDLFLYSKKITEYDSILKRICTESKIHYIDIQKAIGEENWYGMLFDGVHPNSKGHKLIFEIVRDFLVEKKII